MRCTSLEAAKNNHCRTAEASASRYINLLVDIDNSWIELPVTEIGKHFSPQFMSLSGNKPSKKVGALHSHKVFHKLAMVGIGSFRL